MAGDNFEHSRVTNQLVSTHCRNSLQKSCSLVQAMKQKTEALITYVSFQNLASCPTPHAEEKSKSNTQFMNNTSMNNVTLRNLVSQNNNRSINNLLYNCPRGLITNQNNMLGA